MLKLDFSCVYTKYVTIIALNFNQGKILLHTDLSLSPSLSIHTHTHTHTHTHIYINFDSRIPINGAFKCGLQ